MKISAERLEALITKQFANAGTRRKARAEEALARFKDASEQAKSSRLANAIQQRAMALAQTSLAAEPVFSKLGETTAQDRQRISAVGGFVSSALQGGAGFGEGQAAVEGRLASIYAGILRELNRSSRA